MTIDFWVVTVFLFQTPFVVFLAAHALVTPISSMYEFYYVFPSFTALSS